MEDNLSLLEGKNVNLLRKKDLIPEIASQIISRKLKFWNFFVFSEFGGSEKGINQFSAIFIDIVRDRCIATHGPPNIAQGL